MLNKRTFVFIHLYLAIYTVLYSQNFSGRIINEKQEPVFGGYVFVKESSQGLACNEDGEFQATLPAGDCTVEYRCLGYETRQEKIRIGSTPVYKIIILTEKTFELQEVTVSAREDPAYEIMRKAIEKAPYHLNRVKSYKAEAYIKGNMEITKVSKLTDRLSSGEGLKLSDFKDNLFLQESFNEIAFSAPDNYTQTVKAFSSSIPDNLNPKDAMGLMRGSIYAPQTAGGKVSPLNPKAFSYYKFRYLGFSDDDKQTVYKIEIVPKLNDPILMSGYIYIVDNSWDVRHAELGGKMYGIKQNYIITYGEVAPETYLPVTYNNRIDGSMLGVNGFFNYYASVKYLNINLNNTDSATAIIKRKEKKSLNITDSRKRRIETDSLATKRDSTFWTEVRNIPLIDEELKSYQIKDSIQQHVDSLRKAYHHAKFKPVDLLFGGRTGGDSTKFSLKYEGLAGGLLSEYNYADGLWLGQRFDISTKWNNHNNSLALSPALYYASARKTLIWDAKLSLKYAPMRLGMLEVSAGDASEDYNPLGIPRLDNASSTLLWGYNVAMLYRKRYLKIKNVIDITNGLSFAAEFQTASRTGLDNNTHFNFFGGKNVGKANWRIPEHFDITSYGIELSYTPRYYYTLKDGRKQYEYAASPTFTLGYSEGFSGWQTNNSRFGKLEGSISQHVKANYFGTFIYQITGGTFMGNTSRTHITDYKHFRTAAMFSTIVRPFRTFMMLDNYDASTSEYWVESHLNYYSKYILLKRLPFLQGKMFDECLHLKYLYTPDFGHYNELGYSINLMSFFTLGAHVSFKKFEYDRFGIRLSYNLLDLLLKK